MKAISLRRALLVVGGILLVAMGCLPAFSQPVESRDAGYWLGVSRDAEQRGDLSAAYYAYCEALALHPDHPLLNLTVFRSTSSVPHAAFSRTRPPRNR